MTALSLLGFSTIFAALIYYSQAAPTDLIQSSSELQTRIKRGGCGGCGGGYGGCGGGCGCGCCCRPVQMCRPCCSCCCRPSSQCQQSCCCPRPCPPPCCCRQQSCCKPSCSCGCGGGCGCCGGRGRRSLQQLRLKLASGN